MTSFDLRAAGQISSTLPASRPGPIAPQLDAALYEHADPTTSAERRSQLRKDLITAYRPLAERIAWRYRNRGVPIEDLQQVATVGLINAIDRYRPGLGPGFLAFAVPYSRGEVQRYFRDHGWLVHVPRTLQEAQLAVSAAARELSQQLHRAPRPSELAHHLNMPLEDVFDGLRAGEAYSAQTLDSHTGNDAIDSFAVTNQLSEEDRQFDLIEYRHALRPLIANLSSRDQQILALRFFHHESQPRIGERFGLSQMQISRILNRILAELRAGLATC